MIMEKEETKRIFVVKQSTEEKINKVIDGYFDRHSNFERKDKTGTEAGTSAGSLNDTDTNLNDISLDEGKGSSSPNGHTKEDKDEDKEEDDALNKTNDSVANNGDSSDSDSDSNSLSPMGDDKHVNGEERHAEEAPTSTTTTTTDNTADSTSKSNDLDGSAEYSLDDYGE